MADRDATSRIAKILARATSENENEAAAALNSAYARMKRDGVTVRDLLALPEQELYQDALVRLVDLVVKDQPDLSPSERRELYAKYFELVAAKFAGKYSEHTESTQSNDAKNDRSARATGKDEEPLGKERGSFSFSPAALLGLLRGSFGSGSFALAALARPVASLRLLAASALFGSAASAAVLIVVATLHALTGTRPFWDVPLRDAFTFLAALGTFWKARALYRQGWFSAA